MNGQFKKSIGTVNATIIIKYLSKRSALTVAGLRSNGTEWRMKAVVTDLFFIEEKGDIE